jgi:hypothetical protein
MADIGGVWRTVGGRRIFIKDGEDLETAMNKSGKFSEKEINKNEDNKYKDRFSTGTNEQLKQAKKNLEFNIERLENQIKSQEEWNKIATGQLNEQLEFNKDSLREVNLQYEELKREYQKRKIEF